ncbi:MAG: hypothetical protein U5R48_11255 [Gammaproteobacteria bacterium]|nr:hypothetical protein [Gammaproteobacteria bacterium]
MRGSSGSIFSASWKVSIAVATSPLFAWTSARFRQRSRLTGLQRHEPFQQRPGLIEAAQLAQGPGHVVEGVGVLRRELQGAGEGFQCLLGHLRLDPDAAQVAPGIGVAGLDGDRSRQQDVGLLQPTLLQLCQAHVVQCLPVLGFLVEDAPVDLCRRGHIAPTLEFDALADAGIHGHRHVPQSSCRTRRPARYPVSRIVRSAPPGS